MPLQPVPSAAQHVGDVERHAGQREAWVAACAISGIWFAAMARWWATDTVVPWDSKNQFFAFFRFLAEALHSGNSPLWNPYHYAGHPSVADPQSLIFTPVFLLWALIDPTPTLRAFDFAVFAHLLAGGLAFIGLGRRRGWPIAAQILAACIFMFGGASAARLNHTGIILSYGMFPLALLMLETALEDGSWWSGLAFAVLASTIVVGRNQVALLLCLALIVAAIREIMRNGAPMAHLRARAGMISMMFAVGLALSAVPILLTLQFAALSNRPSVTLAIAHEASLYPANLLSMLVPNIFGTHAPDFGYWGPNHATIPEVAATDDTFNYLFFGAVPVILLLWHGIAAGGMLARGTRTWAGVLVFAVLFSLGRYTPLFGLVFGHVPGFSLFRRPIDGTFLLGIALALVVGDLLTRHIKAGAPRLTRVGTLAVAIGVAALITSALDVSAITRHTNTSLIEIARALPFVAAALVLLGSRWRQHARPTALALLIALGVGELLVWNTATRINAEGRAYYASLEDRRRDVDGAFSRLQSEIARRKSEGARPRVEIVGLGGPWQNMAMTRGLESTNGYNPLRVGLYDRYVAPGEQNAFTEMRSFPATFSNYDSSLARALGLEFLVLDRPLDAVKALEQAPAAELLVSTAGTWLYRLPPAMPRVSFNGHVRTADADLTTGSGALSNPPNGDFIVVDDETPTAAPPTKGDQPAPAMQPRISRYENTIVEIEVDARTSGVLVLHDIYYPGWIVTVDAAPRPLLRADVMFRGVELSPGRHIVRFEFRPFSWQNLKEASAHVLRPRPPGWRRTKETLLRLWQPYFPGD